jgi:hypothetical protein
MVRKATMRTTLQQMRYCEICDRQTVHIYDETSFGGNHLAHLFLTIVTFGFWSIIWFLDVLSTSRTKPVCTVCGGVMPEEMVARLKLEEWERRERSRAQWEQRLKSIKEGCRRFIDWIKQLKSIEEGCLRFIEWIERLINKVLEWIEPLISKALEGCRRFIDWSDRLSDKAWTREHNDK